MWQDTHGYRCHAEQCSMWGSVRSAAVAVSTKYCSPPWARAERCIALSFVPCAQAFAAAARHVLPSCDATDCMLLMRGLAAVAAEVAEAAQAGARASPDAGEQAGQAATRLAHAQGQGPVAGKGQEASPLLPLLPEERELLVAVLRRFTVG